MTKSVVFRVGKAWLCLISIFNIIFLTTIFFAFPERISNSDLVDFPELTVANEQLTVTREAKGPTCIIPRIYPDPSWIPQNYRPFSCPHNGDLLVKIDAGFITTPGIDSNFTCYYAKVDLIDDFNFKINPKYESLPTGRSLCPAAVFVVNCFDNDDKAVFENVMRCIAKKPETIQRISKVELSKPKVFDERFNLLIFALDSVSRVGWLEQMKETMEFVVEKLDTVIMEGQNIVGDGTTAQIMAITTGYYEDELPDARQGSVNATFLDDFPFVWKQLANEAGYVTLFEEDEVSMGSFQLRLTGFRKPPVDYYGQLYHLVLGQYFDQYCIGSQPVYSEMISQVRQLFAAYPDPVKKFSFIFSNTFTHDKFRQEAYKIDSLLANELKTLHSMGHFNESILILMADHGSRWAASRATFRGRIAERLPFLSLSFPKWFRQKYPNQFSNLKQASKLLTTHFDLHATLLDFGGVGPLPGTPKRGISFFAERSLGRTCKDAEIALHWCTCLTAERDSSELLLTDPLVTNALDAFENFVNNNLLIDLLNTTCHRLKVGQVFSARWLAFNREVSEFMNITDTGMTTPNIGSSIEQSEDYLQISFLTTPGDGQWEVTFQHHKNSGLIEIDPNQISRTNKYGSAPNCVQKKHPRLRPFCYCTVEALDNSTL